MDLKKLPPSLLVVLGLAACRTSPTVEPCLSPPYDPRTEDPGACLSPPDPGTNGDAADDGAADDGSADEPPVGPCLSPPAPHPEVAPESSAAATVAVPDVGTRREALERVLARATLPADVAARLRGTAR